MSESTRMRTLTGLGVAALVATTGVDSGDAFESR